MSASLLKYDAARTALAEAHRVDEAKDIRDKAKALEVYARQAKDREMEQWVSEIRIRAERRTGELLREMAKHKGGNPNLSSVDDGLKKLADLKITRDESSLWQKLAEIPAAEFTINSAHEQVTRVLRRRHDVLGGSFQLAVSLLAFNVALDEKLQTRFNFMQNPEASTMFSVALGQFMGGLQDE
jgi:hypothetical protein